MTGPSVVNGPHGKFVIRTHRHGVPGILHTAWSIQDLMQRVGRLLNSEKRWVIEVRAYDEDPFGPAVFSEVIEDRSEVAAAVARAAADVRGGTIGT